MWADVYIGGEGVTQQAGWVVRRLEDPEGDIDTIVDAGIFPIPITIGETYTLFLAWDGGRFTFKCNESILNYTPSTLIHPGNNEFRHIGTRVIPPSSGATEYSALISATFDDVLINETGPSINGKWLLDISGSDKGGAVLECSGNSLEGYGVTQTIGPFEMTGSYSVDKKGGISGTYALSPYESGALPYSGTLSGKVDSKVTKLSFKYSNPSISFSGIKLPAEPTIPEDWTVKISGGAKGTFDPFKIEPYEVEGDLIERVHKLSGSGSIQGVNGTVNIDGLFFLTQKNLVYGIYELSGGLSEEGSISGKFTPPSKFSLKAVSETGTKLNIDGQAVP